MRAGERYTVSVLRAGEQLVARARKFGSRNCRSLGGATEPLYLPECESWVTPVSWSLGERVTRRKDCTGIDTNCSQFGGIRWTIETSNRKRRIRSRRKMFSLKYRGWILQSKHGFVTMQNSSLEVDKPEQKSEFGYKIQQNRRSTPTMYLTKVMDESIAKQDKWRQNYLSIYQSKLDWIT